MANAAVENAGPIGSSLLDKPHGMPIRIEFDNAVYEPTLTAY